MNSITINGVRIEVQGSASNISIRNGNVTIGGTARRLWSGWMLAAGQIRQSSPDRSAGRE